MIRSLSVTVPVTRSCKVCKFFISEENVTSVIVHVTAIPVSLTTWHWKQPGSLFYKGSL